MFARFQHFRADESGSTMVEFAAAGLTLMIVIFGVVEVTNLFYQWNAATKAVQWGARRASVSEPVPANLRAQTGLSSTVLPGDPMPAFDYTCRATNTLATAGTCSGGLSFTSASTSAIRAIVYGRPDRATCPTTVPTNPREIGMCTLFPRLHADNVVFRYQYTGLGYAGRPGGPVPTVTISISGLNYDLVVIGAFMPVSSIPLEAFATTATGEDLNSSWSG